MENSLEICNGCGKVPRTLDLSLGSFSCSRCGHDKTIHVNSDEYERVIFNLEQAFHHRIIQQKMEAAMSAPITRKISAPKTIRKVSLTKKTSSKKMKKSRSSTKSRKVQSKITKIRKRKPLNNRKSSAKRRK